jgi:hypothetical protein
MAIPSFRMRFAAGIACCAFGAALWIALFGFSDRLFIPGSATPDPASGRVFCMGRGLNPTYVTIDHEIGAACLFFGGCLLLVAGAKLFFSETWRLKLFEPNQSPDPTSASGTPPAEREPRHP